MRSQTNSNVMYPVGGEGILDSSDLKVKKATIARTETMPDGRKKHYPLFIRLWDKNEGQQVLSNYEGSVILDKQHPVDELICNPITNNKPGNLLGSVVINHLVQDQLQNPGNPEY